MSRRPPEFPVVVDVNAARLRELIDRRMVDPELRAYMVGRARQSLDVLPAVHVDLAELAGISDRTIARLCRPGSRAKYYTLDRLAVALGVHVSELVDE